MGFVHFVWGAVAFGGSLILLLRAAGAVTSATMPHLVGAPRALARVMVVLCWVVGVAFVLGSFGAFRALVLLAVVDAGALAVLLTVKAPRPEPTPRTGRRRPDLATVVAGLAAGIVTLSWLPEVALSYRVGITEADSIWYHANFVIRFLQTGWLTRIYPAGTDVVVPYYPGTSEALDAILIMPWRTDILVPAANLAWLGLLFLAAWCIGSRWDRGPAGLAVAALLAGSPISRLNQPGSLKNEILVMALLLAGVALFLHSERRPAALALAGATLGLAIGTRYNVLAPGTVFVLAGSVGLLRTRRWRAAGAWLGSFALFGSYWYLRNWIRVGNPLPWLDLRIGPIHFDKVVPTDSDLGSTAVWNWRDDPDLYDEALRPGFRLALGHLWWAWAGLLVISIGLVITSRSRWLWALLAAGVLGLVAYVGTPYTLGAEPGVKQAATYFAYNFRYAFPSLALILLAGVGAARARAVALAFTVAILALVVAGLERTRLMDEFRPFHAGPNDVWRGMGLGAGLLAAALLAWGAWAATRNRSATTRGIAAAVGAAAAIGVLFPLAGTVVDRRYENVLPSYGTALWPSANGLADAHIGIATHAVFYGYAGDDFSNDVDYVGVEIDGQLLRQVEDCEEWIEQIRERRLTHLAISPDSFASLSGLKPEILRDWTLAIPGAEILMEIDNGKHTLVELPDDVPPPAEVCEGAPRPEPVEEPIS